MIINLILLFMLQTPAYAKIEISTPHDGQWYPELDEDREIKISGKVSGSNQNIRELELQIDPIRSESKDAIKTKLKTNGDFAFEISQFLIPVGIKTRMTVSSIDKNGKKIESSSLNVFCCSRSDYGYYIEFADNKKQVISISKPNTPLDKFSMTIPEGRWAKDSQLIVAEGIVRKIDLKKYQVMSPPIMTSIPEISNRKGVQITMGYDRTKPRDNMADLVSIEEWNTLTQKKWPFDSGNLSKIVVLAINFDGDVKSEIVPENVTGNSVAFTLKTEHNKTDAYVVVYKY